MPEQWRGINEFYFVKGKSEEKEAKAEPVDIAEEKVVEKEEPQISLVKGTWVATDEELDFNKDCTAKIEAQFTEKPSSKKVTLDAFVVYKNEKEDLGQSKDVVLNDDGFGEVPISLYYGEKYKQAIEKDPDDNLCHYIFKVKGDNCANEIESEKLEMPFLPPCVKERQKKKAAMNASGAQGDSSCTDDCATCEKQEECLKKVPCDHEDECAIAASCQENAVKEEA